MRWRTPAVILACGGLILMLALGTRQSFGLFLRPMSMDLGWGREAFSFAIALQNLVWGCAMPFAGAIADRQGRHPGAGVISTSLPPRRSDTSSAAADCMKNARARKMNLMQGPCASSAAGCSLA